MRVGQIRGVDLRFEWFSFTVLFLIAFCFGRMFAGMGVVMPNLWLFTGIASIFALSYCLCFGLARRFIAKLYGVNWSEVRLDFWELFGWGNDYLWEKDAQYKVRIQCKKDKTTGEWEVDVKKDAAAIFKEYECGSILLAGKIPQAELFIDLAGSLAIFALVGIFYGLQLLSLSFLGSENPLMVMFEKLVFFGIYGGSFTFLSMFPLGGGRMLRALLWGIEGDLAFATKKVAIIGNMVAIFLFPALGAYFYGWATLYITLSLCFFIFLPGSYREMEKIEKILKDEGKMVNECIEGVEKNLDRLIEKHQNVK